ncbi:hypothetical protein LXL04_010890 [Taraxacum kok-saghyz]
MEAQTAAIQAKKEIRLRQEKRHEALVAQQQKLGEQQEVINHLTIIRQGDLKPEDEELIEEAKQPSRSWLKSNKMMMWKIKVDVGCCDYFPHFGECCLRYVVLCGMPRGGQHSPPTSNPHLPALGMDKHRLDNEQPSCHDESYF